MTPGDNPNYYAAAARGGGAPDVAARNDKSPVKDAKPRQDVPAVKAAAIYAEDDDEGDEDEDDGGADLGATNLSEHDRMLDTILVEEELLITAHRLHIEETMELVRNEMNLLTGEREGPSDDRLCGPRRF